ncbi:hypothetical protein L963_1432 [Leuconostoc mesenteroides subsp. cremoris T26]|nr:hypothetical protein L963_1432 [Leuconostoc mesenteroides subsp. cremoris T26]
MDHLAGIALGAARCVSQRQAQGSGWRECCRRRRGRGGAAFGGRHRRRKGHALSVLPRIDRQHAPDGHADLARRAGEARLELDEVVAELERTGRVEADVQHDLAVLHILARHLHGIVDLHRDIGREAVVGAPLVQRPDQVRTCRRRFERVDHESSPPGRRDATAAAFARNTAEPALPGRWCCPRQGVGETTRSA